LSCHPVDRLGREEERNREDEGEPHG
jgi:hypothetical protein